MSGLAFIRGSLDARTVRYGKPLKLRYIGALITLYFMVTDWVAVKEFELIILYYTPLICQLI